MVPLGQKDAEERTEHMTEYRTQETTENIYEVKKQFALRFAKSLRKNGVIIEHDVFIQRLIAYSQQRGIKHITKLKVEDIDKCLSIVYDVQHIT